MGAVHSVATVMGRQPASAWYNGVAPRTLVDPVYL